MKIVIGVTGASGAALAAETLRQLREAGAETHLVLTGGALITIAHELGPSGVAAMREAASFTYQAQDLGAPIASGSYGADAMAVVGTLLAEQRRHPELLETFRRRLVGPRRASLRQALADGIETGELPSSADPEVLASMLIGSFYARYLATSEIPADWPDRTLRPVWPEQPRLRA